MDDGSYAWPGDDVGHLATTHAAVMTYRLLGRTVPGVLTVPDTPASTTGVWRTRNHAVPLHRYSRMLFELGRPVKLDGSKRGGDDAHRKDMSDPTDFYNPAYERAANPIMVEEMNKLVVLAGSGQLTESDRKGFSDYLDRRVRGNGSYNTTVVADETAGGKVCGHIVNTAWALRGRRLLAPFHPSTFPPTNFVNGCRTSDGGYTWTDCEFAPGRVSDITYVQAAVEILLSFDVRPQDEHALVSWIVSLRNADGGFGDRPGAASDPLATYAAVRTLALLKRLDVLEGPLPPAVAEDVPAGSLKAWTIQFQAPGSGSVREAVDVAQQEKIHLWGAKNADPAWLVAAQAEADRRGVSVVFFRSDECYGARRELPGLGSFSHVVDPVTPPCGSADMRPFELWQICDHECFARVMLDAGGYEAVGTFHFGCFDMTWLLPFLRRYEGMVALVANQDSHGETWWWREQLRAYRTVFLARVPTFDAFRSACRKGLVASVRKDVHTGGRLRMIGVRPAVKKALLARVDEWASSDPAGPVVSVQVLTPADRFEVGCPKTGRLVRVRVERPWIEGRGLQAGTCRLERAELNGREQAIARVERRHEARDWMHGVLEDAYDTILVPDGAKGRLGLWFATSAGGGSFLREVNVD